MVGRNKISLITIWLLLLPVLVIAQGSDQQWGSTSSGSYSGPVYYYDNLADAKAATHTLGDVIITKGYAQPGDGGGSTYLVADGYDEQGLTDGIGVFTTGGYDAIIQPGEEGAIHIEQYGAKADDGVDDSEEIQACIDWVLKDGNNVGGVLAGPGIFDLDTGVVVGLGTGEYGFATLFIRGAGPIYGVSGDEKTTFRVREKTGFGLAIQKARKVHVQNIRFLGTAPYASTHKDLLTWTDDQWTNSGEYRDETRSPYSGIVIDPFCAADLAVGYPNHASRYFGSSQGGSSMVTIEGCGFDQLTVAIMNNPSTVIANGDNINVYDCNSNRCKTFFAAGQDQSRANKIESCYILMNKVILDGRSYGDAIGTLPTVDKCNIAGGSKYLYIVNSDRRASLRFTQSYCESLWALGVGNAHVTFNQTDLKFSTSLDYWRPTFIGEDVHFIECQIQYYGYGRKVPLPIAGESSFYSCYLETGFPLRDFSNSGGERLNRILLANTENYYFGKMDNTGSVLHGIPETNIRNHMILGNSSIESNRQTEYVNRNETYWLVYLGERVVEADSANYRYYILDSNSDEHYKVGDQLTPLTTAFNVDEMDGTDQSNFRAPYGVVESINGDTVFLSDCPAGLPLGTRSVYILEPPYLIRFGGNTTLGNDTIKNVVSGTNSGLVSGRRIVGDGFSDGSYIKTVGADYVVMSSQATSTGTGRVYTGEELRAELADYPTNSGKVDNFWIRGDVARLGLPSSTNLLYICTKSGVHATAIAPTWLVPDPSSTNELQNITIDSNAARVFTFSLTNGNSVTFQDREGAGGGGSGGVGKIGTPAEGEVAIWHNDSTIKADSDYYYQNDNLRVPTISLGDSIRWMDPLLNQALFRLNNDVILQTFKSDGRFIYRNNLGDPVITIDGSDNSFQFNGPLKDGTGSIGVFGTILMSLGVSGTAWVGGDLTDDQALTRSNDTLFLTDGGFVNLAKLNGGKLFRKDPLYANQVPYMASDTSVMADSTFMRAGGKWVYYDDVGSPILEIDPAGFTETVFHQTVELKGNIIGADGNTMNSKQIWRGSQSVLGGQERAYVEDLHCYIKRINKDTLQDLNPAAGWQKVDLDSTRFERGVESFSIANDNPRAPVGGEYRVTVFLSLDSDGTAGIEIALFAGGSQVGASRFVSMNANRIESVDFSEIVTLSGLQEVEVRTRRVTGTARINLYMDYESYLQLELESR